MYNKFFPATTKTVTISDYSRPWITKGIRKSITKKHSLYKKYLNNRTEKAFNLYKSYRNKLTSVLRKSEKD